MERVEGKSGMELPESKAGKGLEISWVRGSRYWEKLSERVYINNHYLFDNTSHYNSPYQISLISLISLLYKERKQIF